MAPLQGGPPSYTSPFNGWYDRSSVRNSPRRFIGEDEWDRFSFEPTLVPLATHPIVQALAPAHFRTLLVRHTYRYLDFTAVLEQVVVNQVAMAISRGTVGLAVPEPMRLDAYKIYCDEAYHALFSADLCAQLQEITGVRAVDPESPYFIRRLHRLRQTVEGKHAFLVDLLFVICSELLISGILRQARPSDNVMVTVYQSVRDHAADEGRHHTYFVQFLRLLWSQLEGPERRVAALTMPHLIAIFMDPDVATLRSELSLYGLTRDQAEQVCRETFNDIALQAGVAASASHLIRIFEDFGVLDDPEIAQAWIRLVPEAGLPGLSPVGAGRAVPT